MPNILDQIVAAKRAAVAYQRLVGPMSEMQRWVRDWPPAPDLAAALRGDGRLDRHPVRLIAEVKKASPSRGLLCPDFNPRRLARTYVDNGAAAVSVLTDDHFQGEPRHLSAIKETGAALPAPVLRKDFIFDPWQVYESRVMGADAFLLIAAILAPSQLAELLALGREVGMTALVEVHTPAEIQTALDAGAAIIGINNRDLRTFQTDLAVTEQLAPQIPRDKVIVSESGIFTREHLQRLARLGVNAVLVGEALVTAPDIAAQVRELTAPVPAESR